MNSLSIHTQRATIEITTRPAKMTIQNNMPQFDIRRESPSMRVVSEMPQFTVNDEYYELNKTSTEADVVKDVSDVPEAGDLQSAASGSVKKKEQNSINVTVKDSPDLNVGLQPQDKARLDWEPGYCTIQWSDPVLQIEWDSDFRPTIEWEPYAVEVRLRNRPLVLIRVNMEHIPGSVGARVDHRI